MIAASMFSLTATILTTVLPGPRVQTFRDPGVYYFEGRTVCPFAGLGRRAAQASNRLALDDGRSTVTVDRRRGRIIIVNRTTYPDKATIADLTFLGSATAEDGGQAPLAVHLRVDKAKTETSVDIHAHWTVRGKLTNAEMEPFQVVVSDGTSEKVVASGPDLLRVATKTESPYMVSGSPIDIKDDLDGRAPLLAADDALVAFSAGFAGKKVRVELRSLDAGNTALAGKSVPALLTGGAWQLRLTPEPSLLSRDPLRRELLMGLDQVPVVAARIKKGLDNGDTLAFTFRAGKGSVSWGTAEANVPAVLDVVRAFMEFNVLGTALARHAGLAAATLRKARPAAGNR
jgi:hypothetical protein